MLHPADHAAYLDRHDFPVPPGAFDPAETELLTKYGRWLEALASGALQPTTPGQEQFVRVARGDGDPTTDFERVWVKFLKEAVIAEEIAQAFVVFGNTQAIASAMEAEYLAARQLVLAPLREQLDAVDAAFEEQIWSAKERARAAEKAVRELALKLGRSIGVSGAKVTYHTGRVTWDAEKMAEFAEQHPEVLEFRKVGKPWVALRYADGSEGGTVSEEGERS